MERTNMPGIYARLEKHASVPEACLGTTVMYTIEIENINTHPLNEIMFKDAIPQGLAFQLGSVEIDSVPHPNANPHLGGFPLPPIMPGDTTEITFIAEATHVPSDNPAINTATIDFRTISQDDHPVDNAREISNPVPVTITDCKCDEGSCEKEICKIYSISLPFTVKPFARKKLPDIICFGDATLVDGHVHCQNPQREFDYTLTQQIKVELPIAFGAEICYEETCAEDDGECETP